MNNKKLTVLYPLVVAICLWFGQSPLVLAADAKAPAENYEQQVPVHLKTLITKARYDEISASLARSDLDADMIAAVAASPCGGSLAYLVGEYREKPEVRKSLDLIAAGMQDLPEDYHQVNPWKSATNGFELLRSMVGYFTTWCEFLPQINGSEDNGLAFIQEFAWFYYKNKAGQDFVQGRNPLDPSKPLETGLRFTTQFSKERGAFMDSPASTTYIEQWISDPRIEIRDYQKKRASDYKSWNDFFARELTTDARNQTIPSRPATMPLSEYPKRDYIVVAPTDCIMNPLVQVLTDGTGVRRQFIDNPLEYNTVLDVKGIPLSMDELLSGVDEKYRSKFVGGTGLACVLMPNTYHHFHAPVNGTIVHADVVTAGTYGYLDFPNWVSLDGNVGRPGSDFSQFQLFQRGVIIIEVKYADLNGKELTGYVASIPVGLNTIGSVVLDPDIKPGKVVKRGYTRLGNFFYGGSLDILLFSKGLASGVVQTRMGNQITLFNVGETPPVE